MAKKITLNQWIGALIITMVFLCTAGILGAFLAFWG